MPALTIPTCGYSVGSTHDIDDGIERVVSVGGTQKGWSDYDATKRVFTLVFELCTTAEANTIVGEYTSNRLTGGMTFTPPWIGSSVTADYAAPPQLSPGAVYTKVTLKLREQ